MSLKRRSADALEHKKAKDVIDHIVNFLVKANMGWVAQVLNEVIVDNNRTIKAVGVLIRHRWATMAPRNRFWARLQKIYLAVEPIVEIRPVFETAKVHCLVLDLKIGGRRSSDSGRWWMSLCAFLEERMINNLLKTLKEGLPVELKYLACPTWPTITSFLKGKRDKLIKILKEVLPKGFNHFS